MNEKQRNSLTIGIDCDGKQTLCCLLETQRSTLTCRALWEISNSTEYPLMEQLQQHTPLFGAIPNSKIIEQALSATASPGSLTLLRPLDLGITKPRDISAVLPFQAEATLPYPIEKATLDWLPRNDQGGVISFSIRNEDLKTQLEKWRERGIEIEQLSIPAAALTAFATQILPVEAPILLIHIGRAESTLIRLQEGKLQGGYSISSGIENTKKSDEELVQEVSRVAYALRKNLTISEQEELKLFFTGVGANDPVIISKIEKKLSLSTEKFPENGLSIPTDLLRKSALAIGLALAPLHSTKPTGQINFRKGAYSYPWPWRRIWRPASCFVCLCLLTACSIYLTSISWTKSELLQLRSDYSSLVSSMELTVPEVEELHRKRKGLLKPSAQSKEETLQQLSRFELEQRLSTLREELQHQGSPIPLYPRIPRVTDLLAWLAITPEFSSAEGKPALTLESFDYLIVKRPEKTRPKERYRVKIDLEFSASSPREARAFHDRLLEPPPLLDPKGELKWSTSQGKYRAVFFLRDLTRYSSGGVL